MEERDLKWEGFIRMAEFGIVNKWMDIMDSWELGLGLLKCQFSG